MCQQLNTKTIWNIDHTCDVGHIWPKSSQTGHTGEPNRKLKEPKLDSGRGGVVRHNKLARQHCVSEDL